MTTIKLHNTKSRRKEVFVPIDPDNVRMYVCGPTVYDRAHLGNARPVVVFDVLYRLLRHVYGADHVTYVRNFTDVDDRINATGQARKAAGDARSIETLIHARSDETIGWYHDDMDALGTLRPDHEPRATDFVPQMVTMIKGLIASDHAYVAAGHVLFRVRSYADYGKLSGRSVDDMIVGARVEVAPYKEDPLDFVLWKPSDANLPGWDSPWGRGRPGWHIECSAMADELLGPSFDIHAGGIDLQFPHHENEIAQNMCAHPEGHFANYWLHNEMLQVEGKKMSKSLGNFFTVRDLLDQGVPGEVIRFVLLGTHYSKPMDWTKEKAEQAEATLRKWRAMVEGIDVTDAQPDPRVVDFLADDLNTAASISALHNLAASAEKSGTGLHIFKRAANLLGLLEDGMGDWVSPNTGNFEETLGFILRARTTARDKEDWPTADLIREGLKEAGIKINDDATGTVWSIERDQIDSWRYFRDVRSAFASGDRRRTEEELERAKSAGIHFASNQHLDIASAWRSNPSDEFVLKALETLRSELERR